MANVKSLTWAGVIGCVLGASLALPGSAQAATWNSSGEASWNTAGNWDTGSAPDVSKDGWVATLNSGTAVYTGSSFNIPGTGATLALNGGSFRLEGTADRVNVWWGGKLEVNSGAFNIGSRTLYIGGPGVAGTLNVTGGDVMANDATLMRNGNSTINISGGNVTFTRDLNLQNGTMLMSGGTLNARTVAFYDPTNVGMILTFSGGRMNLSSGVYSYDPSKAYINFTAGSTGVIFFAGDTTGDAAGWQVRNGDIRLNGVTDHTQFLLTTDSTGTYVQLAAVPEPMSAALMALPLAGLFIRRRAGR